MTVKLPEGDEDDYRPVASINVTPLVDVMLVLLIIFMVTAPLLMSSLPIALYILGCAVIGIIATALLTDYTNKDISAEYERV